MPTNVSFSDRISQQPYIIERKIIQIFKKVIEQNSLLSSLRHSFSFAEMTGTGTVHSRMVINFNDENTTSSLEGNNSINILKFTPRDVTALSLASDNRRSRNSESNIFENIYNGEWRKYETSRRLGINVFKQCRIKGYCLNFVDVKRYISDVIRNNRTSYSERPLINQFYFITQKNILLAISSCDAQLFIRRQALEKLIEYNTEEIVLTTISNLLVCHYKVMEKYTKANLREFKQEVLSVLESSSKLKIATYEPEQLNQSYIVDRIRGDINDKLDRLLNNNVFGASDNYSYFRLLQNAVRRKKELEESLYQEAFQKGMQIGLKLEMLGWHITQVKFTDCPSTDMWWSKEVNIVPDSMMHGGIRYIIDKDYQKYYKITKLYINQNAIMKCDGKHPNVAGNRVCMGDLRISFSENLSELQENLSRVETLLDMINYDSSYDSSMRDELLKHATPDQVYAGKNKKVASTGVREISFNEDEDIEEVKEVEETPKPINTKILTLDDGSTINIRENILEDAVERELRNNSHSIAAAINGVSENVNVENDVDTYEIEDRVSENVSFVDENGNLIALNNNVRQVINTDLQLGDANIIQQSRN